MRFASSISSAGNAAEVLTELLDPIDARVTAGMVDLVLLFSTAHFEDELAEMLDRVRDRFSNALIMGCTAEGTIGRDLEIERRPSVSMLAATLPAVQVRPFRVTREQVEKAERVHDWERIVGASPESRPVFLAFADPFSVDVTRFVDQLNVHYSGLPVLGGIASAAHAPNENRLICDGEIYTDGIVGVGLAGGIEVETVVSQGCRPIGKPFVITRGERNIIQELGGRPALARLKELLVGLSDEDDSLARQALFIGRVIDERRDSFAQGDFLIQNIVGVDRHNGALGIAGLAKVGATVQFHVRDASSADKDLRELLGKHVHSDLHGAVLFTCNGRGTNMWSDPGHDIGVLRELLGDVPVGGFFCSGEFGPVGGANFIHGFTASIGLFRAPLS